MILAVLTMILAMAVPAGAITRGGERDGTDHPYVGLMVALDADGNPLWRCSGALIDSTTYVTAGHCTEPPAASAQIWFAEDVESGIPGNGYPSMGDVGGVVHTHPFYLPNAFFLFDLGVVKLSTPMTVDRYASLPSPGAVDRLGKGRKAAEVTAVGYGLQAAQLGNPSPQQHTRADRIRYQAGLFVVDTQGVAGIGSIPDSNSMVLSGDAKHGGTCFGDSGGPILDGDTILGVTSFGLNLNCAGIGGAFRIDRQLEIDWIDGLPEAP